MKYDLEALGSKGFQELAAALCVRLFGPGVQVLGSGRDGGRDLFYDGPMLWGDASSTSGEVWDGYSVIQAKQREIPAPRPEANASWLWGEIRKELEAWVTVATGRERMPHQLLIITNVRLSPTPDTGGLAVVHSRIREYLQGLEKGAKSSNEYVAREGRDKFRRAKQLRKWRIWDGNQLTGLLDAHGSVRQAFSAFLTVGDVLANLAQYNTAPAENLEVALRAHARAALLRERPIYFDQAGAADPTGTPVDAVVTDLPAIVQADGSRDRAIGYVLNHGERILRPKLDVHRGPRHLVITGAPGNGKTTISKFVVQAYRAALLHQAAELGTDHQSAISGTRAALARMHLRFPRHHRWPMRVDLAEYVEQTSGYQGLQRWIASKISERLDDLPAVMPYMLATWRRIWPWILILDGLDEVSEPTTRQRLIENITEFVGEAEAENNDLLVVVTTRPSGYLDELPGSHFSRVNLTYLQPEEAVAYGTLATRVRLGNDEERADRVLGLLKGAAANEAMRNLLRTPLQVLIMTIIGEGAGQFDPDRFGLFWTYYETVLRREQAKIGGMAPLLRDQAPQVLDLHERVGLELQRRSELAAGAMASLEEADLRNIAWKVLESAGYQPATTHKDLLGRIVKAATHRLVLIAPRPDGGHGFDVRSLQELMAARRLTSGEFAAVEPRLRRLAASPHWRNTWIFAAGRYFSEPQQFQHQAITELVEVIDNNAAHRLGDVCPIGPQLALELVDDGMALAYPRWHQRLLTHGLAVLRAPAPQDVSWAHPPTHPRSKHRSPIPGDHR